MTSRLGVAALALVAPVVVMVADPWGWYPFGPVKWLMMSTLIPLGAALVLRSRRLRWSPPLLGAVAVFLVIMAVAAAVGLDELYAWTGTPERHGGLWLWLVCAAALTAGLCLDLRVDGTFVAAGLAVSAAGLGLFGVAEALGWEPRLLDVGSRLSGPLGSSAYLGAAVALLLPTAIGITADDAMRPAIRVVAAVGAAGGLVCALGSGARSAWVGLAAAAVAVAVARRGSVRSLLLRVRHHRVASTVGAGMGVIALVVVLVASPVGGRIGSLLDPDAPGGQGRVDEWRVAARVVADHPVTGVGPEGYRIAFGRAVDADYEMAHGREQLPDRAHSGLLDVALSGGLGALAAWAVVLALFARSARRVLSSGRPWVAGVAAGLVAHWVGQLFLFPLAELEPVAWLLAGIVVVEGSMPGELRPVRVPTLAVAALGLAALGAAVVGGLDVAADHRAHQAVRASAVGDHRAALAAAHDATTLRPDVVRYHLLEARTRSVAGRGALAAIESVDDALAVSPRDPIARLTRVRYLVERAVATEVPAHARRARAAAKALLVDDPINGELRNLEGEAAHLAGDDRGAEQAWLRAERLMPEDPEPATNLALLHWDQGDRAAADDAISRALARGPDDERTVAAARLIRGG